jgi:hypothetical protein
LDRIDETNLPDAQLTASATIIDCDGNTWHAGDLVADIAIDVGQYAPQTTTRAAVADGQELLAWRGA